jgi:hypothetical protein
LVGEVNDLRDDVDAGFLNTETPGHGGSSVLAADEWTDPVAADAAGLEILTATVAEIRTVTSFLAPGVAALLADPRNITFTNSGVGTPADAPDNAVVTGTDINDDALTETISVPQTATISAGAKCFKTITSVVYEAGDGTTATVSIGFGSILGLHSKIKSRAGAVAVLMENEAGTVKAGDALAGTYADAATSPPHGSYDPGTAPDGSNDYCIWFERDLT